MKSTPLYYLTTITAALMLVHFASGQTLWTTIPLLLIGIADIVAAIRAIKKRRR